MSGITLKKKQKTNIRLQERRILEALLDHKDASLLQLNLISGVPYPTVRVVLTQGIKSLESRKLVEIVKPEKEHARRGFKCKITYRGILYLHKLGSEKASLSEVLNRMVDEEPYFNESTEGRIWYHLFKVPEPIDAILLMSNTFDKVFKSHLESIDIADFDILNVSSHFYVDRVLLEVLSNLQDAIYGTSPPLSSTIPIEILRQRKGLMGWLNRLIELMELYMESKLLVIRIAEKLQEKLKSPI